MEFEAKVIDILAQQSGTSKAGKAWQSREVITETLGSYPKKVKLKFIGDRAISHASRLAKGQVYTFFIDLESREYNGRWYTEATCYNVRDGVGQGANVPGQAPAPMQSQTYTPPAQYGQRPAETSAPGASGFRPSGGNPYASRPDPYAPHLPGMPAPSDTDPDLPF